MWLELKKVRKEFFLKSDVEIGIASFALLEVRGVYLANLVIVEPNLRYCNVGSSISLLMGD